MKTTELAFCAMVLAISSSAHAHLRVESHTSRHTQSDQKVGPCGKASGSSTWGSAKVYTYAPGETISVEIDEYIAHPGWFRISFDNDGNDDFASPKSIDPPSFMDNDTVLMDNLDMHESGGGIRKYEVKLPDVECEKCTLQVIQVMLDKPPYDPQDTGAFSNDIYYACIDLKLKGAGGNVDQADAGITRDAAAPTGLADAAAQDAPVKADAGDPKEEPDDGQSSAGLERDAGVGRPRDAATAEKPAKRDAASSGADDDDADEEHQHGEEEEQESGRDDGVEQDDDGDQNSTPSGSEDGCALSNARASDSVTWSLVLLFVLASRPFRSRRRG